MEVNAQNSYFESETFKLLLKSIVEESLIPLNKKVDMCLEELRQLNNQEIGSNDNLNMITTTDPITPLLQLEINFALKISDYQDFSKTFVISPLVVILGIYPFFKNGSVDQREEIGKFLMEKATDEKISEYFIDLLKIVHSRREISESDSEYVLSYGGHQLHKSIIDDFVSTKLKHLELHPKNRVDSFVDENDSNTILVNTIFSNSKFDPTMKFLHTAQSLEKFRKWPINQYAFSEDETFRMIQIRPQNYVLFNVFLPKKRFGLADALKSLDAEQLYQLHNSTKCVFSEVITPRLNIHTETELGKLIESMGIDQELYQKTRNLLWGSKTKENEQSFVHRAQFELNLEGLDHLGVEWSESPRLYQVFPPDIKFIADHPFLFMLIKDGHLVYFGCHH